MPDRITLKSKTPVTHDTHHYVFDRPEGLQFEPGQAAELALDREGWRDEGRPFTFTSLPSGDDIAFVIKSYPSHDGVTEQMADLQPGAQMTLDGPFGAITDQGPGVFLAAGAGVTPFIAILRKRAAAKDLSGCRLIFSNKTPRDIILRGEFEAMDGLETTFVLTDEGTEDIPVRRVDADFLKSEIEDTGQMFYLCGPQEFVDDVRDGLKAMGVDGERIVTEEGW